MTLSDELRALAEESVSYMVKPLRVLADRAEEMETQLAALRAAQGEHHIEAPKWNHISHVPDHCDRIIWRGHYYHLPTLESNAGLSAAPPTHAAQGEPTREQIDAGWSADLGYENELADDGYTHANRRERVRRILRAGRLAAPPDSAAQGEPVVALLDKAFNLGQQYWQQADSQRHSDHRRAEVTLAQFHDLRDAARRALATNSRAEGEG